MTSSLARRSPKESAACCGNLCSSNDRRKWAAVPRGFEVQLGDLAASAASAREAARGASACAADVRGLAQTGAATGSPACAGSFEAMVNLWSDQLEVFAEAVDALSEATRAAREGYDDNDAATSRMFRGGRPR